MTSPLSDTQTRAWRSFVVIWRMGLPSMDRTFRKHGLIHIEYGILSVLREQPDRRMRTGDLAELSGISSSRLSHRLKAMEERGDVERRPAQDDGRMVDVVLTEQGTAKVLAASDEHRRDIVRLMFDPLDDDQTEALADALSVIASHLTDHPFLQAYQAARDEEPAR